MFLSKQLFSEHLDTPIRSRLIMIALPDLAQVSQSNHLTDLIQILNYTVVLHYYVLL